MTVLAKSVKGMEYFYNAESAHQVPKRSAKKICDDLNSIRWNLKENETWHSHEVDRYDNAFYYAEFQKFYYRNGYLREKH